jgi:LacI family transcriptional regulator
MTKKSTIQDLAKALNITPSTVSRALNNNPRISEATKKAVQEAAKAAGYQVNQLASSLRIGRSFTIGVVVPTADRSFFAAIMRSIEDVANKGNYNVMICQSNDSSKSERNNLDALIKARVDGIAVSIAKESTDLSHFDKLGVPLVFFDRTPVSHNFSSVDINDYNCAYQATKHLIEQGYRRIAHIGGAQHINIYRKRLRGYQDALTENGLELDNNLLIVNDLKLETGKTAATALLNFPQPPDAVFCASDFAALGTLQVAKQRGLSVPQDFGVVGFANEPFTAYIEPSLTTVDQHPKEMGETIAKLLLEQIEQSARSLHTEGGQQFIPRQITLNGQLIIRNSSTRQSK